MRIYLLFTLQFSRTVWDDGTLSSLLSVRIVFSGPAAAIPNGPQWNSNFKPILALSWCVSYKTLVWPSRSHFRPGQGRSEKLRTAGQSLQSAVADQPNIHQQLQVWIINWTELTVNNFVVPILFYCSVFNFISRFTLILFHCAVSALCTEATCWVPPVLHSLTF